MSNLNISTSIYIYNLAFFGEEYLNMVFKVHQSSADGFIFGLFLNKIAWLTVMQPIKVNTLQPPLLFHYDKKILDFRKRSH